MTNYRENKVLRSFRMRPSDIRTLKVIAETEETTVQAVLERCMDLYFHRWNQQNHR